MFKKIIFVSCVLASGQLMASQAISTLVDIMVASNPQIEIARLSLQMDRYQAGIQESQYDWQVQLNAEAKLYDQYALSDDSNVFLAESQAISASKKLYDRVLDNKLSGYNYQIKQRELELQETESLLLLDFSSRYVNLLQAKSRQQMAMQELSYYEDQLEEVQSLFDLQQVYITDLYESEAAMKQAINDVAAARIEVATALASLNELLPEEPIITPNFGIFSLPKSEYSLLEIQQQAQASNHGLLAKEAVITIARNDLSAVNLMDSPKVNFNWQVQRKYYHQAGGVYENGIDHTAAVTFTMPIGQGSRSRQQELYQLGNLDLAREQLQLAQNQINSRISQVFHSLESTHGQIEAVEHALATAELSVEAISAGLSYGVSTRSQQLSAKQKVYGYEQQLVQMQAAYMANWLQLQQLTGALNKDLVTDTLSSMVE